MTKQIKVVNADTAPYKVSVIVQSRIYDENGETKNWRDVEVLDLSHPCATADVYITHNRRLMIVENGFKESSQSEKETNGKYAYACYMKAAGLASPSFDELSEPQRNQWIAAGNAPRI